MQNHHIERHEKPAVANGIAKYTRLCKGREERFFLLRNAKFGMRNEKVRTVKSMQALPPHHESMEKQTSMHTKFRIHHSE